MGKNWSNARSGYGDGDVIEFKVGPLELVLNVHVALGAHLVGPTVDWGGMEGVERGMEGVEGGWKGWRGDGRVGGGSKMVVFTEVCRIRSPTHTPPPNQKTTIHSFTPHPSSTPHHSATLYNHNTSVPRNNPHQNNHNPTKTSP